MFNETNRYEYSVFGMRGDTTNTTLSFEPIVPDEPADIFELSSLERLDNSHCIQAYGRELITDRGDVILSFSSSDTGTIFNPIGGSDGYYSLHPFDWTNRHPFDWMRLYDGSSVCDTGKLLANPDSWTVAFGRVDYCLSMRRPEQCRLRFNPSLLAIVIAFNAVKIVCW